MRLLLFLLTPLVELYLLIVVGGYIGAVPMVAWVVASMFLGVIVLRRQGVAVLARGMAGASASADAVMMIDGFLAAIAAVLLIVPGLLTDAVGLLLLVPFVRHRMTVRVGRRAQVFGAESGRPHAPGQVIEGEFERRP